MYPSVDRKELKVDGVYDIMRGRILGINLKDNGFSQDRRDWADTIMNKEFSYQGTVYLVRGIEAFAAGMGFKHEKVGLLVREIKE